MNRIRLFIARVLCPVKPPAVRVVDVRIPAPAVRIIRLK